jgi:hypothetical protein
MKKKVYRQRKLTKQEEKLTAITLSIFVLFFILYKLFEWISKNIFESIIIFIILTFIIVVVILKVPKVKKFFTNSLKFSNNIKDEEIKSLTNVIQEINLQEVRNEEDFEKQLFQRLDAKDFKVERQYKLGSGKKIDLIVNNCIGIELKVADRSKNIQDLIGQIIIYKKYLKKIIICILDYGNVSDMEEYIQHLQNIDSENIYVLLIKGNVKRYKKKEEYILVKKTSKY